MKRVFVVPMLVVMEHWFPALQNSSQAAQTQQKALLPPDIVDYFNGDWAGKGKFTSGKDIESAFSFVPDLEAQCIVVRQKERPPNTFNFIALWSVDSISKEVVML
ncbi:MAG: hypothetical protein WBW31_18410 [Candidatus Sulfotelmatobacter sp.]